MNIWDRIFVAIIGIFFLLYPFLFNTEVIVRFDLPKHYVIQIVFSLLLLLYLIRYLKRKLYLNKSSFLLLLLFLSTAVSTIFSQHFVTSVFGLLYSLYQYSFIQLGLGIIFTLVLISWLVLSDKLVLKKLVNVIVTVLTVVSLVISVYGLVDVVQKYDKLSLGYRLEEIIGEPNRLGFFLITILPLQIVILRMKQKWMKILGSVSLSLTTLAILATFSRGSWLIMISILGVTFFLYLKNFNVKKTLYAFVPGLLLLLVVLFPFKDRIFKHALAPINDLKNHSGSISIRLEEWNTGLKVVNDFSIKEWIIGIGPQNTSYQYLRYRDPQINVSSNQRNWTAFTIRNHYLEMLIGQGLIGLASWLFLIIYIAVKYVKNHKTLTDFHPIFLSWSGILLVGVIYYIPVSLYPLFWIFTAILLTAYHHHLKEEKYSIPSLAKWIVLLVTLSCLVVTILYYIADKDSHEDEFAFARKFVFWDTRYKRGSIDFMINENFMTEDVDLMQSIRDQSEALIQQNPYEIKNHHLAFVANFYSVVWLKDMTWIDRCLEIAQTEVALDPSRPGPYNDLGQVYLHKGMLEDAEIAFLRSIEIDPDYYIGYLHLGETYKQQQDYVKSLDYYFKAMNAKPVTRGKTEHVQGFVEEILDLIDKDLKNKHDKI